MESFRITKLEVDQVGPFGKLVLEFPEKKIPGLAEVHILTGENGTGKTTILEMLAAGFAASRNRINERFRIFKENGSSQFIVKFSNGSYAAISRGSNAIGTDSEDTARVWENLQPSYNSPRQLFAFAYSGYRQIEAKQLMGIQEIRQDPVENALDFQNSVDPQLILQWIANTIANEAIASIQKNPTSAKVYRDSISRLEKAIAEIIEQPIRFILESSPLEVVVEVKGERLNFNLLPDGLKSIFSWLSDLLMRMDRLKWIRDIPVFERNFILFLDEIEVHLHPAWQRKILPAVQKLFPNAQIFISTHSPFVVGSVDGAWIHKLVKPNGDSQLAEGYPMLSEDGRSFRLVLEEDFGISKQFGEGVEKDLQEFRRLVDLVGSGATENLDKLVRLSKNLSAQSLELHTIIQLEMRQLQRKTNSVLETT